MSRIAPALYLLAALATGALAGLVGRTTTVLPGWTVQPSGSAVMSDQALTRLFEATARYSLIGAVGGLLLGLIGLVVLRRHGWRIVPWSILGPLLAGLTAWGVGVAGGTSVQDRLAQAGPGTTVPIDLTLGTPVAVLLWPFAAMLVVLLASTVVADPDRSVAGADRGEGGAGEPDKVGSGDLELQ